MCESIEEAMQYLKGYCNKHPTCEGRSGCGCRLYSSATKQCFLYNSPIPADWEIMTESEGNSDAG